MSRQKIPLQDVKVAAPCPADWNAMTGNDRVRFCGQCELHVYNLSALTQTEAEHLIAKTEGRLCVRYFSRADGTVLTQNCPTGLRAARQKVSRWATAVLSAALSFAGGLGVTSMLRAPTSAQPATSLPDWRKLVPLTRTPPRREPAIMGAMIAPPRLPQEVSPRPAIFYPPKQMIEWEPVEIPEGIPMTERRRNK